MNSIVLVGRLGQDPEVKSTTGGTQVANFSLATKDGYGDKQKTNWHNIVVFGKGVGPISTYLKKGSLASVTGHVEYRSWDDKTTGEKKYRTEIISDRVEFLSSNSDTPSTNRATSSNSQADGYSDEITDDDIPF